MGYDLAARRRLGRAVRDARRQAGYTNRMEFADKVGRSARQIQALENGEDGVGPDTYAATAETLGWPLERMYEFLDDSAAPRAIPPSLASVTDEDLAAEVLRRMRSGGEHGGDTAATKDPGSGPGSVTYLGTQAAARDVGKPPRAQRQPQEPDLDDPPHNDPHDYQPS